MVLARQFGSLEIYDGWRWQNERYVALKVARSTQKSGIETELVLLKRISRPGSQHKGSILVRKLLDSFTIPGIRGDHVCPIFEPLREPLWLFGKRFIGGVIPNALLKVIVHMVLQGLDYLHSECKAIHADLKPGNIMVKIEDPKIFERDAKDEHENPLEQKHIDGRIIYLSRNNYGKPASAIGVIQITDFDLSRDGSTPQNGPIQAETLRAPEIILGAGFSYTADIWSLGATLWWLVEGRDLFHAIHPGDYYNEWGHIAHITALLGPVPSKLKRGERVQRFYESDGELRDHRFIPSDFNFEKSITKIAGEEKAKFIAFVKRMIRWDADERSTAKELLDDPWLDIDFPQD